MNVMTFAILLASFFCWIVTIVVQARVFSILRRRHTDFYKLLPKQKHSPKDDVYTPEWLKFQKGFFWNNVYASLHDPEIKVLCQIFKVIYIVFMILVVALFIQGAREMFYAT